MFCGARYGASLKSGISGPIVPALSNRGLCVPALALTGWVGERQVRKSWVSFSSPSFHRNFSSSLFTFSSRYINQSLTSLLYSQSFCPHFLSLGASYALSKAFQRRVHPSFLDFGSRSASSLDPLLPSHGLLTAVLSFPQLGEQFTLIILPD
jgi:hypothetical protein